ncbi:glycine--tRNA ligase [Candidatus Pacearchaeota archaeon]|nr:glycine--tRNA ligase [Candidatus Pacearchaeota archaeon]|tara:strand:+ start:2162 stop:3892 length:1731 start_codon:yes stop_codon:yes gene_type:complete
MFIVKKKIGNKEYYYLRKSERKDGKVVAKTVAYLGKTKKEAEVKAREIEKREKEEELGKLLKPKVEGKKMDEKEGKDVNVEENGKKGSKSENGKISIEDLAVFCKRKGFVFRSSEIYGGFSGFWDFGPLGTELFNNLRQNFWKFFVQDREDMVGMEASIISHPKIWEASGHLKSFSDIAVTCKKCKKSTKIDKSELGKVKCENCGGEFIEQGEFNLMFKTSVGALDKSDAYLRGETAQGMFTDFNLIWETGRKKLPFGIAQIGRCFRNEIAPRDFLFRCREFHIGEFEYFIHPDEKKCNLLDEEHKKIKIRLLDEEAQKKGKEDLKETTIGDMIKEERLGEWHGYWLAEQVIWFDSLGLSDKIKIREHTKDELSHYSSATFDFDFEYPFGSLEVAGNANRGQFDLTQHGKFSGEKFEVLDEKGEKVVPRVIEPTFGMERVFLALIAEGYRYDEERQNIVLKLPKTLAPIKAAVFPIVRNDAETVRLAREVFDLIRKDMKTNYDESGSVGRRYSRNDEIGTPYCITIDSESLKGKDVTIRNRDTKKQVRVKISELKSVLQKLLNSEIEFEKAGKLVS